MNKHYEARALLSEEAIDNILKLADEYENDAEVIGTAMSEDLTTFIADLRALLGQDSA